MPPRPVPKVKQNRPISAIYLGKDANSHTLQSTASSSSHTEAASSRLPDLQEPPSPTSSTGSVQSESGLPSPPGTNSNGSGSTGDPATVTLRERSLSRHTRKSSMSSGTASTPMKHILNGSEADYDDYDEENGNDNDSNDDTLKVNKNVMALQRAKSLAERSRMGPSRVSKLSRSMSAASSHRPSPSRSGSETEREINSPSSSNHHRPSPSLSPVSLRDLSHQRRTSAPTSASVSSPNSSPNRRRRRPSIVSKLSLQLTDSEEEGDNGGLKTASGTARTRTRDRTLSEQDLITQSALAAVASSRSPLSSRWRAGLPKEFRSDIVDSPSPASPSTGRISVADAQKESRPVDPVTPFRRPSTIREYPSRRSDFGSLSTDRQYNITHSNKDGNQRRQTLRGGSAESALISPGGRSLITEGLKAAGLSKKDRRVEWSPEVNKRSLLPEREKPHSPRVTISVVDNEDDPDRRYRDAGRPAHRLPSRDRENSLPRAEISMARRESERDSIPMDRAGSSFTRYNRNNYAHSPSPAPRLSTPRRTFERLSTPSPFGIRRRNAQSPAVGSSSGQTEHVRLMLESLAMLETQLNKVKFVGNSSTGTGVPVGSTGASQTELAKETQSMVYAAERLSGLLKQGNWRAVEEQVEAEVEGSSTGPDTQEISDIWGRVAAEYRENSRVADELVRGITGFLLGIGRVVRDIGLADCEGRSPSAHGKHLSFDADEEGLRRRRESPSPDVGSAGSGRRALSSSREPRGRDRMVVSPISGGADAGRQRPKSVLANRASPATHQKWHGDRELQFETPPSPSQHRLHIRQTSVRKTLPALPDRSESARKLFTPREQREQMLDAKFSSRRPVEGSESDMRPRDSQEKVQLQHERSPTPASRTRGGDTQEREGILSPLKIPKPLPTLPSETLVRRQTVNNHVERIASPTPAATTTGRSAVRSNPPPFPSLTSPSNPTTALTPHTASNSSSHSNISAHTRSGSTSAFPLQRSDSNRSNYTRVSLRASGLR